MSIRDRGDDGVDDRVDERADEGGEEPVDVDPGDEVRGHHEDEHLGDEDAIPVRMSERGRTSARTKGRTMALSSAITMTTTIPSVKWSIVMLGMSHAVA